MSRKNTVLKNIYFREPSNNIRSVQNENADCIEVDIECYFTLEIQNMINAELESRNLDTKITRKNLGNECLMVAPIGDPRVSNNEIDY